MASRRPKQESLSRYFKDLDEFKDSDDDSDKETSQDSRTSNEKTSDIRGTKKNSEHNSVVVGKPDLETAEDDDDHDHHHDREDKLPLKTLTKSFNVRDDTANKMKLPSASECLGTRSTPSFLKVTQVKEINWDARQKRLGGDDDGDSGTSNFTSNAVPPPSSYEPITDPGIKVVDSEGRKRKTVWSDLEDQTTSTKAYKVHKDDDVDKGDDGS